MKECGCGAPLRSDSLRCAQCGAALTLDRSQTGTPGDIAITHDWDSALIKLAGVPGVSDEPEAPSGPAGPSAESLREVRRQSRLRQIKRFFNR